MKRMTAVIAIMLSAASFTPAEAQLATNLQFRTPLNYRFSVQPKSHVFFYNRKHHHHGWRHRHRQFLPVLAGPAVIYQNGDIGIPPEDDFTASVPAIVQPVVYRLGETGGCGRQQVSVPGGQGRTTVNIWRC
jgi:hypothetical protein